MTSSWADRRLLLAGLVGLLVAGSSAAVTTTSATFSAEAVGTAAVGVARACTGDVARYTSGLLDAAAPVLRWSFSAAPEVGTTAHAAPVAPAVPVPPDAPATPPGDEPAPAGEPAEDPVPTGEAGPAPMDDVAAVDGVAPAPAEPGATPEPEPDPEPRPDPAPDPGLDPDPGPDPAPGADPASGAEPAADPAPVPAPADGVAGPAPAPPLPAAGGLLACDPVDLAAGAAADPSAPRALDLPGGTGSGLSSDVPVTPTGPVTVLLWVHLPVGAPDGDLVALRVPGTDGDPGRTALVLTVVGDEVRAGARTAEGTGPQAATPLTRGTTHLVAAVVDHGADGAATVRLATDDGPASAPVPLPAPVGGALLTLGAHEDATSTAGRVDEVTLVPGALGSDDRAALVAADRWWAAR